jgi:hypothetical protein
MLMADLLQIDDGFVAARVLAAKPRSSLGVLAPWRFKNF